MKPNKSNKIALLSLTFGIAFLTSLLLHSQGNSVKERVESLYQWDVGWYGHIAENGYVYQGKLYPPDQKDAHKNEANVGFFPLVPLLTKIWMKVLGVDLKVAIWLAGAPWCFVAIAYFCSLGSSIPSVLIIGLLLFLTYPGSFFLGVGYTEPLLIANALGVLYWLGSKHSRASIFLALHAFLLTLAHIRGVGLLVICVFTFAVSAWQEKGRLPFVRSLTALVAGASGVGGFFMYLQFKFGHWDLYLQMQRTGWFQTSPNLLAPLDFHSYLLWFEGEDIYRTARVIGTWMCLGSVITVATDLLRRKITPYSIGAFFASWVLLSLQSADRVSTTGFYLLSMPRYGIFIICLLILWWMNLLESVRPKKRHKLIFLSYIAAAWAYYCQGHFIEKFTSGQWVS